MVVVGVVLVMDGVDDDGGEHNTRAGDDGGEDGDHKSSSVVVVIITIIDITINVIAIALMRRKGMECELSTISVRGVAPIE